MSASDERTCPDVCTSIGSRTTPRELRQACLHAVAEAVNQFVCPDAGCIAAAATGSGRPRPHTPGPVHSMRRSRPSLGPGSDEDAAAVDDVGGFGGEQDPAGRTVAAFAEGARFLRVA